MSESLNENRADFKYKGRKYEVDLLLDSMWNGFATYDIFDVTGGGEECVGKLEVELSDKEDYGCGDLKRMTIEELGL